MFLIRLERNPRVQDDHAVGPPLDRDIALQPFDLAKGRLCQNRGCIPTHVSSPKPMVSCGPVFLSSDIDRLSLFQKGSDALFIVVPAKAGTHAPCRFVLASWLTPF